MQNKNSDCNCGVRCNVNDCVYNEHGCNCNKEVIDVSLGDGESMPNGLQKHYCKSFISKTCERCDNVEASQDFESFNSPFNKPYDEQ